MFPDRSDHVQQSEWGDAADIVVSRKSSFSPTEAEEIKSGTRWIAVYGRVTYSDGLKIEHWAKFCTWISPAKAPAQSGACVQYNRIDRN